MAPCTTVPFRRGVVIHGQTNRPAEWGFSSGVTYDDPFDDVVVDVEVTGPGGRTWTAPAYWAGEHEWRVRFASPDPGCYEYETVCSDESNPDLHGRRGRLEVDAYDGKNDLYARGPLEIVDGEWFAHRDGTPFFWLGDAQWMSLVERLEWPGEFKRLVSDRKEKGFTVVGLAAGLFCDMYPFDDRGRNEAGWSWEEGFERINPGFFDMADERIEWLVASEMVPWIFGAWGYYLRWTGVETMKRHWRHLIARYGAYPVVWSLTWEFALPYYNAPDKEREQARQQEQWAEICAYVRQVDPFDRPLTTHGNTARYDVDEHHERFELDYDTVMGGHGLYRDVPGNTRKLLEAPDRVSGMPTVFGEGYFEGMMEGCREEVQRYVFWATMLSGYAGFTYGANGIWQINREEAPFGPSPHGGSWGDVPWTEAYQFPGSEHVGTGKRLLEDHDWWRFESHPEWIDVEGKRRGTESGPFAGGVPGQERLFYFPTLELAPDLWDGVTGLANVRVTGLDPEDGYDAAFVDPKDGDRTDAGEVAVEDDGTWRVPQPGATVGWVLVLRVE